MFLAEIDPSAASVRRVELISFATDGAQARGDRRALALQLAAAQA